MQLNEMAVTDSNTRRGWGGGGEIEAGEKQRHGTQQVLPARLPHLLQDLILSQRNDDTATATQQQPIHFCRAEQKNSPIQIRIFVKLMKQAKKSEDEVG